ncbi:hypothetical protein QUF99_25835 [Bacillus sp. DX4.1]|uniref:hypothetical protein n=1 Tax=Bacillus sp. DX4.1 TaxID=3055867 RepID=UPI0025A0FE4F|nr:hypothetical protein [Bacillus sp. DX4.1]MDM5190623.1 hypothetical protein [Bacillus sp. DX4.1]
MKIYTRVKSIGKRRPVLQLQELEIGQMTNLRELIIEIVTQQVKVYNEKPLEEALWIYLVYEDLEEAARNGRVGFGERKNENQQDLNEAIQNAIQSFEDGLYCVLVGDEEISDLDAPLDLKDEDVLTFIRLTMLAGRAW